MKKLVGIQNSNAKAKSFYTKQKGLRLTLKPGMNEVDVELAEHFAPQIREDEDLFVRAPINDVPRKGKVESKDPAIVDPEPRVPPAPPADPVPTVEPVIEEVDPFAPEPVVETSKEESKEESKKIKIKPVVKNAPGVSE